MRGVDTDLVVRAQHGDREAFGLLAADLDGRVLIGGDTTDSTSVYATKGARTAIVLKPGSPVHAVFEFEVVGRPAASCLAFLDAMIDATITTVVGDGALEPIEGTVEFDP